MVGELVNNLRRNFGVAVRGDCIRVAKTNACTVSFDFVIVLNENNEQ